MNLDGRCRLPCQYLRCGAALEIPVGMNTIPPDWQLTTTEFGLQVRCPIHHDPDANPAKRARSIIVGVKGGGME